jgi:hypothetical protein
MCPLTLSYPSKHVFSDLRAYVCTFENCQSGLFQSKSEWFNHEVTSHRRVWNCFTCADKVCSTKAAYKSHLQNVHNYHNPELVDSILNSSSRPLAEIDPADCPLCFDWSDQLKMTFEQRATTRVSLNLLRQHLGIHQEQLALFSITPDFERDVGSDHGSEESEDGQVDKAGVSRWRGSILGSSLMKRRCFNTGSVAS